ncbi:uncharacterized protein DUF4435 [Pseudomonas sp. 29]|uniref:DUF4435 domain-containing protein n=1 Tax=Pseudomonas sp. 29 TaxID=2035197 RepID=UPI000C1A19B9|nr:DUF4435 domain-containing protein [Pseudomonas sp. 29]PIF52578.1 uncharacterized protein DUF4435 [Pseudomonas sp. 29]
MSNYKDLPIYSTEGGAARDIFLSEYFDLLFYFEDENQEYIYEQLLIKIGINEGYAVICTGGKTKFKEISKETSNKKRIFVCDKDFDDITGEAESYTGSQFIYLGRFCFENYLISENAIIGLLREKLKKTSPEISPTLDYQNYWERLTSQYEKLSRLFAVARNYRVGIKTTKADAKDLVNDCEEYYLAPTDEYIDSIRNKIIENSQKNGGWITEKEYLPQLEQDAFNAREKFKHISDNSQTSNLCGKHLLRILILHSDKLFGSNVYEDDFQDIYCRLISHSDPNIFEPVRQSIERALAI